MFKVELVDAIPRRRGPQDLFPGRLVRSLPRAAHAFDGIRRRRLQADEARRRLLARRPEPPAAAAHLRHGVARRRPSSTPISTCSRRRRSATTDSIGREMELFHLQEEAPGQVFWHPKGWAIWRSLEAYMRRRLDKRRLSGGQDPAASRPQALGGVRALGEIPRVDVPGRGRGRERRGQAGRGAEADELPRPRADLQPGHQVLPRPAAPLRRVRLVPPLRAVGRDARHHARARLHAGRRAHLLPRGSDHTRRVSPSARCSPRSIATSASTSSASSSPTGRRSAPARTRCGTRRKRR